MKIYNVYQSGKRLYIDEKENPDNKIVVNKYDNMQQTLRLISDGTLPPRLYWALRNPKLSNKYFILKLVNNEDLIVGTDISAYAGLWDMLLIGTDEDYIIEGADIDQSRLTYVSDHFGRLFVRDNFLEELDFEEQCSPTFKVFYDEIMFRLDNIPDLGDIPDKLSDLENDTNFISGVALKDDGEGHVEIIGTTFSGGETEEGEIPSGGSVEVDDKLDEESTNPVQNKVVAKEVNSLKQKDESLNKEVIALRERNAELEETVEKLQIKTTTSPSPFHHITDSANMKVVDFGMEGITEQETTSGKNLCDLQIGKCFNTTTGEIREQVNYAMCIIEVPKETKVTISIPSTEEHGWYLSYFYHNGVNTSLYYRILPGQSQTVTLAEGITMISGNAFDSTGNIIDFKPIKVQIEEGTVATEYEPFTNGASPNPFYPQEIVNAGVYNEETGRYEHKCCVGNKNWCDLQIGKSLNAYTGDVVDDKMGAICEITVPEDMQLIASVPSEEVHGAYITRRLSDKGLENIYTKIRVGSSYPLTLYKGKNIFCMQQLSIDATTPFDTFQPIKIQIEVDTQTNFIPHASQQFTLTSPVPLTKWDKLVKRDGVWGYSVFAKEYNKKADELNLTANNANENEVRIYVGGIIAKKYSECRCDIFSHYNVEAAYPRITECGFFYGDTFCIWLKNDVLEPHGYVYDSTVESSVNNNNAIAAFKTLLEATGGIHCWVDMQEEQAFHPLPDEEQTLLHNLETYYGVTNVYNEQGCPITLSYISDPELHWNQKLEQINNALLSLGANV